MEKFPEAGVKLHPYDTAAVFEIYIKATPELVWEAITDPELRAKYSFGVAIRSDWTPGSEYRSGVPGVGANGAVRRLADDPVGSQNAVGDRRAAHDARLAAVLGGIGLRLGGRPKWRNTSVSPNHVIAAIAPFPRVSTISP
jgi:hypothetical protein